VYDLQPRMKSVVYCGMDLLCPGYNKVLSDRLTLHHGSITIDNTVNDTFAHTQTGNLHVAIYDLTKSIMHVSKCARLW